MSQYNRIPTFAAFQPVKVNNPESAHHGRAGYAVRAEAGPDGAEFVRVALDATTEQPGEHVAFAVAEVAAL